MALYVYSDNMFVKECAGVGVRSDKDVTFPFFEILLVNL